MLAVMVVEIRKLNRSLALLLALAAPGLIGVFNFFNMLRIGEPKPWDMWLGTALGVWAFFMLPMSVTALTALIAHMEHGSKAWEHLRALPVPRWRLYAAKAICVLGVVALMSVLTLAFTWAAVSLAALVNPSVAPLGAPEWGKTLAAIGRVGLAAILMIAVQFWVSLRFQSFVPGLALGIGGTFFAVVATAARPGVFLPWQMPVNTLMGEAARQQTALGLGCGLGLVVLALATAHLSRREVL